jgi:hypothetical protein
VPPIVAATQHSGESAIRSNDGTPSHQPKRTALREGGGDGDHGHGEEGCPGPTGPRGNIKVAWEAFVRRLS